MSSPLIRFLILCVTICLCFSLVTSPGYATTLKGVMILSGEWKGQPISYLDKEILVGLKPGKVQLDIDGELGSLPVVVVRVADRFGFLKLRAGEGEDLFDVIDRVGKLPSVKYAEPNMVDHTCLIPNDTHFSKQWHYHNTGQSPPGGTADADIDAPEAWNVSTGVSTVRVGVLDSGIPIQTGALSHPDLDDPTRFLFGYDFINSDAIPNDDNGHGTHVSGTIAAETDNGIGVAGVCWNAQIMAIKVFDNNGSGSHEAFRLGCIYAADNGCDIINYSGGGSHSATKEAGVSYANANGVIVCAATGNDNSGPVIYPAAYSTSYSNVIAVSATNHNDVFSSYSNKGPEVTVAAPGGHGGSPNEDDVFSTMPNYYVTLNGLGYSQDYDFLYGTSMATPHVSGVAALVLSTRPSLSPSAVRDIIKDTADDLGTPGFDQYYGWGRVNAGEAMSCDVAADFTSDVTNGCEPLTVNFTDLSNGPVTSRTWYFGDGDSSTALNPSHTYTSSGTLTVALKVTSAACTYIETKNDYITIPVGAVCRVEPTALDFGTVYVGEYLDTTFTITNDGCGALTGTVSAVCAHHSVVSGGGPYSLAIAESLVVTVRFAPTSTGTHNCTIQTGTECANVSVTGVAVLPPPTCQIDPDTLDFGGVELGGFTIMNFDITNVGYGVLTGTVSESCGDYSITSATSYALTHDQTHTVSILFFPLAAGPRECTIETGNTGCVDVFCTGVGTSPASCDVDPDTLLYGSVLVGNYSDKTFIIANTGGDVLAGDVSEACSDYSITSGGGPYSLAASESLVVTVRFEPASSGVKECTIETGNGICSDVYCSGLGDIPPICDVEPDSLMFGIIAVDDSLDHEFIITNTGGSVLSGSVSESCSYYELVSGGGPYALGNGDTVYVTVRYKPTVEAQHECTVETGGDCVDVYCSGEGTGGIGINVAVPGRLTLYQNYPNPFNPTTTIAFWLPEKGAVHLSIFDVDGRLIRTLAGGELDQGMKEYVWNGTDTRGNVVSSGVYFYQLKAGGKELTRKMVLLK